MNKAFTLIEVLVSFLIVSILVSLSIPVIWNVRSAQSQALSAHTLHQLMVGAHNYLAENDNYFWPFREYTSEGTQWWFGFESWASQGAGEGNRFVDFDRGPLSGAAHSTGLLTDPAFFQYRPRLKPKYRNGNCGYGYNTELTTDANGNPRCALNIEDSSAIVVFATCAQVNTFQNPASSTKPMIEEFYMINTHETTVHFRHGGNVALAAFLDGSVRPLSMANDMVPGSQDSRLPKAHIGKLKSSYLKQDNW